MNMLNCSAKENTNAEGKSENESGIQGERKKCENLTNNIRKHYSNNIIAHVNINSLRNKFGILTNSVTKYIDILMISETKLDDTFPHALYHLKDFSNPYRLDRNSHGGGTLVSARHDISSDVVKLDQKVENF